MGKITDLVSKGVRLIVTEKPETAATAPATSGEIPPGELAIDEPQRAEPSTVAADVADFTAVYQEAGITLPAHGYGIDKVGEMLENKRFATLSREAKAAALMVALEAASAPVREVVQDAVRRDRALDAFEADKQRELSELKATNEARVQELNRQLEELIQKINAEVADLKGKSDAAERAFADLQVRKRREEERLHAVVAHFVEGTENPITTGASAPTARPAPPEPASKS